MRWTFLYTIKVLLRDRDVLLWAFIFPLFLLSLFQAVLGQLDQAYEVDPLPVVIVHDANYDQAAGFANLIEQASQHTEVSGTTNTGTSDTTNSASQPGATSDSTSTKATTGSKAQLTPVFVSSVAEATALLPASDYLGYIQVNPDATVSYSMNSQQVSGLDLMVQLRQSILLSLIDRYTQNLSLITHLSQTNPAALADPGFMDSLNSQVNLVERGAVTTNPVSDSVRYFYAAMAFAIIMMQALGLSAIEYWKANTSPLGARRSVSGQSWSRTLAPTLLACWLISFIGALISFCYIRFGFGVSFGGKEPACLAVLAIGCLVSVLVGALIGALPLTRGKSAISIIVCNFLSLLAGLYGSQAQELGDYVARTWPGLSALNPVRQIFEAFMSLYYYDDYARLGQILIILTGTALTLFIICIAQMRRQRYRSL